MPATFLKTSKQISIGVLRGVFLAALLALGVAFVYRQALMRHIVTSEMEKRAGVPVEFDSFYFDFSDASFWIGALRFLNPEGFKDPYMVEIAEATMNLDLLSFVSGRGTVENLEIHISRLWYIKNEKGVMNTSALKGGESDVIIKAFFLALDTVLFKDYTVVREPITQELKVNVQEEYKDLDGFDKAGKIVGLRGVSRAVLHRLNPANPEQFLEKNIFDPLTVTNAVMTDAIGSVTDQATGAAKAAVTGTQEAAGQVVGWVTSPFRGDEETEDERKE